MAALRSLLDAATALAGDQPTRVLASSSDDALQTRLDRSFQVVNETQTAGPAAPQDLKLQTAQRALQLILDINTLLVNDAQETLLGSRDWMVTRALFAIIFAWGTNSLLASASPSLSSDMLRHSDRRDLRDMVNSLLLIVTTRTQLAVELLNLHLADLLRACYSLGWDAPQNSDYTSIPSSISSLLQSLSPERNILALAALITSNPAHEKLDTVPSLGAASREAVNSHLSQQLLRDGGVRGLLTTVLGEVDQDQEAPFDRMERVAAVLCTVPATSRRLQASTSAGRTSKPSGLAGYFTNIIRQLFSCLNPDTTRSADVPAAHRRAAAFTICQMLKLDFKHTKVTRPLILRTLHLPLLPPRSESEQPEDIPSPIEALHLLMALMMRMDPSPPLVSAVVAAIVPSLVSLLEHFAEHRATEPELREGIRAVVLAWARVVSVKEVVDRLWASVLRVSQLRWEGTGDLLQLVGLPKDAEELLPISQLVHPNGGQAETVLEENLIETNAFMLQPDPARFIQLLKGIGRPEASADLFVQILEAYHASNSPPATSSQVLEPSAEVDPRRPLLLLQLAFRMQSDMPEALESLAKQPDRLLAFVRTVLEQAAAETTVTSTSRSDTTLTLDDLRMFKDDEPSGDSDDEDGEGDGLEGGEIVQLVLSVLLSLLELHESLLPLDSPQLLELNPSLLHLITYSPSQSVRRSAREAAFNLRARLSAAEFSSPTTSRSTTATSDDATVIYQRAIALLSDQLLPVRASGLSQLRNPAVLANPALRPAVLDALLRTLGGVESFLYLNAVQGLVALAVTPARGTVGEVGTGVPGREVLATLLRGYAVAVDGMAEMEVDELDRRLRLGEALAQVIIHLQDAVVAYLDILLPPFFVTIRAQDKPTVLRSSALGLLAQCIQSAGASHAMSKYTHDIANTCLDIMQLEAETARPPPASKNEAVDGSGATTSRQTLDDEPTSTTTKHPPLRRAAAHVATLLLRAEAVREASQLDREDLRRMHVVFDYVAATDVDAATRAMCRESVEAIAVLIRSIALVRQ